MKSYSARHTYSITVACSARTHAVPIRNLELHSVSRVFIILRNLSLIVTFDRNIRNSEMKKKHIDDVQTQTVDEHMKLILEDDSTLDPNLTDVTSNDLPDWYDEKLFKEGQNYYKRNMLSILVANTVGLIVVFSVPRILKVLQFTKRSSSTCMAFKRYIETLIHVHNLYTYDPNDTNSKWYKSMNVIRWNHKMATRKTKKAGIGEITQRDMVLTQYSFAGYVFTESHVIGLCNTSEEEEAFNHFWRVNGYMLGIPDRFNLCRKNAKETKELCKKVRDAYATYLKEAPAEFYDITSNALDALWYVDITADKDAFLAFTYKLHGLPYKKLGWYSWIIAKYREWIFYLCSVPYIRPIVQTYNYYFVLFVLWNSENFPLLAWAKFGKENIRLNLYPKY